MRRKWKVMTVRSKELQMRRRAIQPKKMIFKLKKELVNSVALIQSVFFCIFCFNVFMLGSVSHFITSFPN